MKTLITFLILLLVYSCLCFAADKANIPDGLFELQFGDWKCTVSNDFIISFLFFLLMIIIPIVIGVAAIAKYKYQYESFSGKSPQDILEKRLVIGDISIEEYEKMKKGMESLYNNIPKTSNEPSTRTLMRAIPEKCS